jgi:hypothetical protein
LNAFLQLVERIDHTMRSGVGRFFAAPSRTCYVACTKSMLLRDKLANP